MPEFDMPPNLSEMASSQLTFFDGTAADFDNFPTDLTMPENARQGKNTDIDIKLGPLQFDYSKVKEEVLQGSSLLRILKDKSNNLAGFSVLTPGTDLHNIKMIWVNPSFRKGGVGSKLINDAVSRLPNGQISMDIWGGEPMVNLARKYGFIQNPGENMANRFIFLKQ